MKIQNENTDSQDLDIAKVVPKTTTLIPDTKVAKAFVTLESGRHVNGQNVLIYLVVIYIFAAASLDPKYKFRIHFLR